MNIFVWTEATNQVEYRIASQAPAQWTLLPAGCRMVSGGRVRGRSRQSWGVRSTGTSPMPGNWMGVIGNYLLPGTGDPTHAGSFHLFINFNTIDDISIYLSVRSVVLTYMAIVRTLNFVRYWCEAPCLVGATISTHGTWICTNKLSRAPRTAHSPSSSGDRGRHAELSAI